MLGRIFPQEFGFFELFNKSAGVMVEAAQRLKQMGHSQGDLESHVAAIKDLEHQADSYTHETMNMLHKTFITPLEREDIHELIKRMDDILDFMDACAQRVLMYELKNLPPDFTKLVDITVESCEMVKQVVFGLRNMKKQEEMLKLCVEINRLENAADQVLRSAVAALFRDEQDLRRLIKLKEVFELLETVTDRCEDVANIVESIILEHA